MDRFGHSLLAVSNTVQGQGVWQVLDQNCTWEASVMLKAIQMGGNSIWIQRYCISVNLRYIARITYARSLETAVGPDFAARTIQVTNSVIGIPRVSIVMELDRVRN